MNDKIRELYVKFHTARRLKIEALTEHKRIQLIEVDGRENSPHVVRDALYWAMEQTSEEDELNVFAELIVTECANIAWNNEPDGEISALIKQEFGVE